MRGCASARVRGCASARVHRCASARVRECAGARVLIGRVVGTLVATQKHRKLVGAKLLLVQPLTLEDQPKGVPLLAIDSVGAGVGDKVLYLIEGKAAQEALGQKAAPVDAAIMGIIDSVTLDPVTA